MVVLLGACGGDSATPRLTESVLGDLDRLRSELVDVAEASADEDVSVSSGASSRCDPSDPPIAWVRLRPDSATAAELDALFALVRGQLAAAGWRIGETFESVGGENLSLERGKETVTIHRSPDGSGLELVGYGPPCRNAR